MIHGVGNRGIGNGVTLLPHLLRPSGRAILRDLAAGRALLAFDFDGTLAPIAGRPEQARMRSRTRRLLARVAGLYPCAVISGRARNDVLGRMRDIPVVAVAGSHGAEAHDSTDDGPRPCVRSWVRALRRRLRHLKGVLLEVKPHGVAIHYRQAAERTAAHATILSVVAALPDTRHIRGNHVVEVMSVSAPHKGHALTALRRRLNPQITLYVGDDVTDEDAFSSDGPGGLVAVRVGRCAVTTAMFRLDEQVEVEMLLRALIQLAPPTRRRAATASES